jgi:hypothetical protein
MAAAFCSLRTPAKQRSNSESPTRVARPTWNFTHGARFGFYGLPHLSLSLLRTPILAQPISEARRASHSFPWPISFSKEHLTPISTAAPPAAMPAILRSSHQTGQTARSIVSGTRQPNQLTYTRLRPPGYADSTTLKGGIHLGGRSIK